MCVPACSRYGHLAVPPTDSVLVSLDMLDLEEEEQGTVTMFRLIVERMVVRNQEAHALMVGYLTDFDIYFYDGESITSGFIVQT